jgi:leader peptidase (prepilin peptidase)/N-methyltransferase
MTADPLFLVLVAFVLGACVGSFLNVVIYRLPRGVSVASPARSFCPQCRTTIPWYRNLPLVTWLWQNGKCASCGSAIPVRYLLVEAGTALIFAMLAARQDVPLPLLVIEWTAAALLVAISVIDFEFAIIPDPLTVPWIPALIAAAAAVPDSLPLLPSLDPASPSLAPVVLGLAGVALGAYPALFVDFVRRRREVLPDGADPQSALPEPDEPFSLLAETREFFLPLLLPSAVGAAALVVAFDAADLAASPALAAAMLAAAGAGAGMLLLFTIRFVFSAFFGREAMGLGDAKFLGFAGALLGVEGAVLTFAGACVLGALPAFASLLRRIPLATLALLAAAAAPPLLLRPLAERTSPPVALAVTLTITLTVLFWFLRRLRRGDIEMRPMPFGPFLALAALALVVFREPLLAFLESARPFA